MSPSKFNNGKNIDHHPSMIITSNFYSEDQEEDPYSSFYNFPSPYIHYEDGEILFQHLHDLFSQQQHNTTSTTPPPPPQVEEDQPLTDGSSTPLPPPPQTRKRSTCKSDRHSKIQTAQGSRDRRMRLSLQVARPFFDLQDMLGFDKASKTVEWLLKRSKTAIKELYGGDTDNVADESVPPGNFNSSASVERNKSQSVPKEKKSRASRKYAFDPNAKETREKARARARERTVEKRKLHESRLATNWVEDGGNFITSNSLLEQPFTQQQLHVSDYDVLGQIW